VHLFRPMTARLLLSTVLLASTARWAATDQRRQERTRATQQAHVNALTQRAQLERLNRALALHHTQRQLDQRRLQAASPGIAAHARAQCNETQKQLDQHTLEQQLQRVQQDLKLHAIAREHNPLRRQQQISELALQQHMQCLQEQSRTQWMQQQLNRFRESGSVGSDGRCRCGTSVDASADGAPKCVASDPRVRRLDRQPRDASAPSTRGIRRQLPQHQTRAGKP